MIDAENRPVPELHTGPEREAWAERFHILAYGLGMTAEQIAATDCGFDPAAPEGWQAFAWARHIANQFPVIDTAAMIEACRKDTPC